MYEDLGVFFEKTAGGRHVPPSLRPSITKHLSRSLFGHGGKLIAEGTFDNGGYFQVSQHKPGETMWMEVFRPDKTLQEQHHYEPNAKAYALHISTFSENGKQLLNHKIYTQDGRLVEEVKRNEKNQLARISCVFPDIRGIIPQEREKFAQDFHCQSSIKRTYRDMDGEIIVTDEHRNAQNQLVKEMLYDDEGQRVSGEVFFHPNTQITSRSISFNWRGIKESEMTYNRQGDITHHRAYYTHNANNNSEIVLHAETIYKDGAPHIENHYREDGTKRARKVYDAEGKIEKEIIFNSTGEFARETRDYKNGIITRKTLMEMRDETPEVTRIIMYDNGRPYRSREHRWWKTGDDFWSETEINPQTGRVQQSMLPTPTGLVKQIYDPKTGRIKQVDRHREEFMGETLEKRIYYYPATPANLHPERNDKDAIRRIEEYDTDGKQIEQAQNYYTDGSIRAADYRETNGTWVHRVYPKGTQEVEDNTPYLYESIHREDGTKESSTLRLHPDPAIRSLQREYDEHGKPNAVYIDSIDGDEYMSWEDYTKRRQTERNQNIPGLVRLATIAPDIQTDDKGQTHNGRTLITLQGTADDLKKTIIKLKQHISGISYKLHLGDEGLLQQRNQTGAYVEDSENAQKNPHIERVNVLSLSIPATQYEGETWPRHFTPDQIHSHDAKVERARAVGEAVEALRVLRSQVECDLGIEVKPGISHYTNKTEEDPSRYFPYAVIEWPDKPYLPEAQSEILHDYLYDQIEIMHHSSIRVPNTNIMNVLISEKTFTEKVALRVATKSASELQSSLIPARARKSEPEAQL